ncbi:MULTISPECIES: class I adenylate-forming enzyme family protein [Rhodococcus]|uniref:AMP-binding protein n=1 Tax=Rhodococcus oxybenzonivorans TaxID=1990687 RepID=A0AAE4V323_9NOCA|nr:MULTISPECIES: AMP-binding protein [Rhodococcus]MDV7242255.1 AMP-binding protein [Rhodococcus oxybenzonivorans]MDV7267244.1 AMP-binding protein [Rhodococcus oxybenzonivorans]MDV7276249.1 AMP-binding protein [Rhodococcus oxybenzonivorans]MDV7331743.1 AMP-binding protein [Rhodococcus oxybenzonivorans]MDV7343965.1 AMP-binding protein [Rhodococcus oxybenzonivorans]
MTIAYLPWLQPVDRAERPCLRDSRSELTFAEVAARVDALAVQLAGAGVTRGDVVAIMLPNRIELLLAMMAAWRLGAAATPINPVFTAREVNYQVSDSGAVLIVVASPDSPTGGVPAMLVDDIDPSAAGPLEEPVTAEDDLALLIYTSGSTGQPKGVMIEHGNLLAMSSQISERLLITAADRCLLVLPLFHANAICVSFLPAMLNGGELTILERFEPYEFLAAIETYRPTYFAAVPTIYARLAELPDDVDPDTSSLRFVNCGAAPVSRQLLERVSERYGFSLVEGYGLTEGTCASACNPLDGVRKLGSVGTALPGQEIAIVAPDGTRRPTGESGEVVVKGPNVMGGYLNRPAETALTVVDGWLHTGDVGVLDDEGYLTLVDRIKDMIIRGGENLYPKEIESVLVSHPDVLEAAVVGQPDDRYGEIPIAFVTTYPGSSLSVADLLELCRQDLTKVKIPAGITILGELPRNPVGKIDKPSLRASLQPQ